MLKLLRDYLLNDSFGFCCVQAWEFSLAITCGGVFTGQNFLPNYAQFNTSAQVIVDLNSPLALYRIVDMGKRKYR